jgi:hypothetical protein
MRSLAVAAAALVALCALSAAAADPSPKPKATVRACPSGKVQIEGAAAGVCGWLRHTCPPGRHWSELHDACVDVCPAGKTPSKTGIGCVPDPHGCPADTQWFESRAACLPFCAPGKMLDPKTPTCVDDPAARTPSPTASSSARSPQAAPAGSVRETTKPVPRASTSPTSCPEGKEWKAAWGGCVPKCSDDEVLDFNGIACHPIRVRR